jgi:hypothetical protein
MTMPLMNLVSLMLEFRSIPLLEQYLTQEYLVPLMVLRDTSKLTTLV